MSAPVLVPDAAAGQRQILRDLAAEYGRQLRQILQVGELVKGSVYQIETRCGNPGCHCATPRGQLHPATVLSWSEAGRTRMRSLGVDQRVRVRRLSEQYRRLRQARADVVRLHQQMLHAIDQLEQALRLPPPPCRWPATCRPLGRPEAAWLRFVTVSRSRMRNCSRKLCGLCPWKAGGKTGCATPTACSTILSW